MQVQLVCPALPAWLCIAVGTRPGHGPVQQRGPVMAIGVNLVSKASRQGFRSCVARGEQTSEPRGEMAAQFLEEVAVVLRGLQRQQGRRAASQRKSGPR